MASPTCWICGLPATTGEHMIKKSDLPAVYGKPTSGKPLFLHNAAKTNHIVQGLNSDALKLASRLCAKCNNERSQPAIAIIDVCARPGFRLSDPTLIPPATRLVIDAHSAAGA